jgi:plastocyanin
MEQPPGKTVDIVFTHAGSYNVLCNIHPKMRLEVHVE